jgi:hypothetical protein
MEIEMLKEKWFTFRRMYCKEGFVDMWQGDQADTDHGYSQGWDDGAQGKEPARPSLL